MHKGLWWEIHKGKDHKKSLDICESIILKWIFEIWDGVLCIGFIWLGMINSNEPSDPLNVGKFLSR
jgi:hypothetical protein